MNDASAVRGPSRLKVSSLALPVAVYRWWRRSIVGIVDHPKVIERIEAESGISARYIFMTMMSAGIAVLGLLLSSPAVVIGAMLISPLMGPILGMGFGLALFDLSELRRAFVAVLVGALAALAFTALIVLFSPLKAVTPEILARTRPNLFDLLVALFAALAGTFAIIRGRGDTIVGVAIATALMPPIAVVGYGLATWNLPVLAGSLALFATNLMTIALAATIMARFYGFGHSLSREQSWAQSAVLVLAFVAMAVPLAISLGQIAREALIVNQVRSSLSAQFGPTARVTQLDVDFRDSPWSVRAVVIAPRDKAALPGDLRRRLEESVGRRLDVQIDQVLVDPSAGRSAERAALARANAAAAESENEGDRLSQVVAVAAGAAPDSVTIDREHRRIIANAAPLPGAGLAAYRALEVRIASAGGWDIAIVPPMLPLPAIGFTEGEAAPDAQGAEALRIAIWAAKRWNLRALAVPGLLAGDTPDDAPLAARRARAVADALVSEGITPVAAPAVDPFRLALAEPPSTE